MTKILKVAVVGLMMGISFLGVTNRINAADESVLGFEVVDVVEVPLSLGVPDQYMVECSYIKSPVDIYIEDLSGNVTDKENALFYYNANGKIYLGFRATGAERYYLQIPKSAYEVDDIKITLRTMSDDWFLVEKAEISSNGSEIKLTCNVLSHNSINGIIEMTFESLMGDKVFETSSSFQSGLTRIPIVDLPPGEYNVYAVFKSSTYMDVVNISDNFIAKRK